MTDLRKAADTLEMTIPYLPAKTATLSEVEETIAELRQALAQPEQKPVAWMYVNDDGECEQIEYGEPFDDPSVTPLYTAPPKREWVGLTDEVIWDIKMKGRDLEGVSRSALMRFAREVEEASKEKNT